METEENKTGFGSEGTWLDEEDVREHFKNKPQQAQNTIDTARQIWHPQRQVTLYEVLEYKSKDETTLLGQKTKKRVWSQEDQVKAKKAPKPPKADKPPSQLKLLSEAQKKRAEALVAKIDKTLEDASQTAAKSKEAEVVEMVPKKARHISIYFM